MSAPLADGPALAALAAELAEPTRATVCLALLDGRAWTLTELAAHAGVARSTLSAHATRMVADGLLAEERQGRHRYLRLAGPESAGLVETLAAHAAPGTPVRSLRGVRVAESLAAGRTCYDHLAGRLGVELLGALVARGHIAREDGLALTAAGAGWLAGHGVDVEALRAARRPMVRSCLDWTERRSHLAGGVGAALLDLADREAWVLRDARSRAVTLTPRGAARLQIEIGL